MPTIYVNNTKVEVTEEFYAAYMHDVDATWHREKYHDKCFCPYKKKWMCNGDCDNCKFHKQSDTLSLDYENADGEKLELEDSVDIANIICDSFLLKELFEKLCEIDPDGKRMMELWSENPNISDRAIARELGRNERTFADQIKKIRKILNFIRAK